MSFVAVAGCFEGGRERCVRSVDDLQHVAQKRRGRAGRDARRACLKVFQLWDLRPVKYTLGERKGPASVKHVLYRRYGDL